MFLDLKQDGWINVETGIEFMIHCALFALTQETGWHIRFNRNHEKEIGDGDLDLTVHIEVFITGQSYPAEYRDYYLYNHYCIEVHGNCYSYKTVYQATLNALNQNPNFVNHYHLGNELENDNGN